MDDDQREKIKRFEAVSWFLDEDSSSEDEMFTILLTMIEHKKRTIKKISNTERPEDVPVTKMTTIEPLQIENGLQFEEESELDNYDFPADLPVEPEVIKPTKMQPIKILNLYVSSYVRDTILKYTDEEFKHHLKLSREWCNKLTDEFIASQYSIYDKSHSGGRSRVPNEHYMFMFLWFVGSNNTLATMSKLFGINQSTANKIMTRLLLFFEEIVPTYIRFPEQRDEKEQMAEKFQKMGEIGNIIGCLDRSYFNLCLATGQIRSAQLVLQAICDADLRFLDINVWSNEKPDSQIFQESPISKTLAAICEDKFHVLGEEHDEIRTHLITPYANSTNPDLPAFFTNQQIHFNETLRAIRSVCPNAFALMKKRFPVLNAIKIRRKNKWRLVMACCVLHNICMSELDDVCLEDAELCEELSTHNSQYPNQPVEVNAADWELRSIGEIKRDAMCDSL